MVSGAHDPHPRSAPGRHRRRDAGRHRDAFGRLRCDGPQVAAYAAGVDRAWAAQTNPVTGAVTDKLPPGPHAPRDYNYGTFQMADAQLRSAERTGDTSPAATAVAVINGIIARNGGAPG